MAIEPLSSAMTFQAQNTQQAKPVTKVVENTEVATPEKAATYDATTVRITAVDKQDGQESSFDKSASNQQATNEQIKKAVEKLNKNLPNSEAVFGIHEETNRVTIKIVDKESKEVIKELPPEKTLDLIAKAWEIAGLLVDEKR